MDTIYITGHRNPDTDSIVSAMAYAALKNALGQRQYEAARLGQISDETQTVLDRFGFQPPKLLNNVRTQARDRDYDTPATLSAAATISRAWRTMQKDKISAIPVANEDGTLFGMLSAGDVANYDMSSVRNPKVGEIPVYNLLSVLEGKILNQGGEMRDVISGEGTIALPASRENLVISDPGSIVVCGDQPDMIRRGLGDVYKRQTGQCGSSTMPCPSAASARTRIWCASTWTTISTTCRTPCWKAASGPIPFWMRRSGWWAPCPATICCGPAASR